MKKTLFTLALTTCLALSMVLSSCSMIKRHYSSGYYVSHNSAKPDVDKQEPVSGKRTRPSFRTVQNMPERTLTALDSKQSPLAENATVITDNKNVNKPNRMAAHRYSSYIVTSEERNIKSFDKKAVMDSVADDALSLFWIIILILLILWLVAILSGGWGLGDYVHILLVIALVLLILWLLRII